MKPTISRRNFVAAAGFGALAGPSLLARSTAAAPDPAPQVLTRNSVKPVVIAPANGNHSKDAEGLTCVAKAFKLMTAGADPLDAIIAGVNIVELDPEDTSVGYGGLPNADGVLQLDCSMMHGPLRRAGAVAALEGVRTPSLVAKAVMENTDHLLLAGQGAQDFARHMGFKIERDLGTEKSRRLWLEWKRRTDPEHYLNPKQRSEAWHRAGLAMVDEGLIDPWHFYGTINCDAVNSKGEVCGVTSTSGLAWKVPGRVGDSPIFGAGLYVDAEVGAAGSSGRGEANLFSLGSFLVIEGMRHGMSPKDAGMAALQRVLANTIEKRLLNHRGKPNFDVTYYALNTRGDYACVSLYELAGNRPARFAVCTEDGPATAPCEPLFPGTARD